MGEESKYKVVIPFRPAMEPCHEVAEHKNKVVAWFDTMAKNIYSDMC